MPFFPFFALLLRLSRILFHFSPLDALSSFFVSKLPHSTFLSTLLPSPFNATFMLSHFLHYLTLPPSSPSTFSFTFSSLPPGFNRALTYFNFFLHLSSLPSLHHLSPASFPRSFHPFHSSLSWPHIQSSIPQLPALRTSAIVNLVQPQEVGHQGTLKHVTL